MSETPTVEEAVKMAEEIGREHGVNAASWWEMDAIGGRFTGDSKAVARKVLAMLDDGDPEIYGSIPEPDLSGEWADGYSSQDLMNEIYGDSGAMSERDMDSFQDVCDAYERGFLEASEGEIVRVCKLEIEEEN